MKGAYHLPYNPFFLFLFNFEFDQIGKAYSLIDQAESKSPLSLRGYLDWWINCPSIVDAIVFDVICPSSMK